MLMTGKDGFMKKIFMTITSVTLLLIMLCTNVFAYTSVKNAESNVYDTYTVDVGVTRTIVGRGTIAYNSSLSFLTMAMLGTLKNSSPTKKTIAVSLGDSTYQTHEYNITTTRAGYTNTKLSGLSTKNYTWQTVSKYNNTDSYFAGLITYSNQVTSNIAVRTRTGNTQGYQATPSVTVAS